MTTAHCQCRASVHNQTLPPFTSFTPHPNPHYQPFIKKTFMLIGVIATGVASPVTMDKICPIIFRVPSGKEGLLMELGYLSNANKGRLCVSDTKKSSNCCFPMLSHLLQLPVRSKYREARLRYPSIPSGLTFYLYVGKEILAVWGFLLCNRNANLDPQPILIAVFICHCSSVLANCLLHKCQKEWD